MKKLKDAIAGTAGVTGSAILAGLALALVLGAGAAPLTASAAEPIRIGDINSYKRLPAHTIPYKMGVELALEEINAAGGVLGRPLELVSRDDAGKPGEAVKIAEELVSKERVALISGSLFSHIGLALTSFAGEKKVLYVAAEPLADALVWTKGNRYTFRLRPSTYMQASMLASEAAKNPRETLGHHRAQLRLREGRGGRVQEGADAASPRRRVRGRAVAGAVQDRCGGPRSRP